MIFSTSAALLDAIVLAVVARDPQSSYGYRITQQVKAVLEVSESTLYPVLRRLQTEGCLSVYEQPVHGRLRRYYRLTPKGEERLAFYTAEWKCYTQKINTLFEGEES